MSVKMSEVVAKVREIAAARPDVKYTEQENGACLYAGGFCSDGSVGCIVGQALRSWGLDVKSLDEDGDSIKTAAYACRDIGVQEDDYVSGEWLDNVQHWQDNGRPWGEAIRFADGEPIEVEDEDF